MFIALLSLAVLSSLRGDILSEFDLPDKSKLALSDEVIDGNVWYSVTWIKQNGSRLEIWRNPQDPGILQPDVKISFTKNYFGGLLAAAHNDNHISFVITVGDNIDVIRKDLTRTGADSFSCLTIPRDHYYSTKNKSVSGKVELIDPFRLRITHDGEMMKTFHCGENGKLTPLEEGQTNPKHIEETSKSGDSVNLSLQNTDSSDLSSHWSMESGSVTEVQSRPPNNNLPVDADASEHTVWFTVGISLALVALVFVLWQLKK